MNYNSFWLSILNDPEQRKQHMGYRYIIQTYGGTPHTAYRTKSGLRRFLSDTGLKIHRPFRKGSGRLSGRYIRTMLMVSRKDFDSKYGQLRKSHCLDNGDYVRCYIETGAAGNTIYLQNCNMKDREVLDYSYYRQEIH
jgi:hypothetical protein